MFNSPLFFNCSNLQRMQRKRNWSKFKLIQTCTRSAAMAWPLTPTLKWWIKCWLNYSPMQHRAAVGFSTKSRTFQSMLPTTHQSRPRLTSPCLFFWTIPITYWTFKIWRIITASIIVSEQHTIWPLVPVFQGKDLPDSSQKHTVPLILQLTNQLVISLCPWASKAFPPLRRRTMYKSMYSGSFTSVETKSFFLYNVDMFQTTTTWPCSRASFKVGRRFWNRSSPFVWWINAPLCSDSQSHKAGLCHQSDPIQISTCDLQELLPHLSLWW